MRGAADALLAGAAEAHLRAFVTMMIADGHVRAGDAVFIGRDRRKSSPRLAGLCRDVVKRAGLRPVDCGALPTPALALHAGHHRAAAVMVTGSHIAADRNGLKFFRPDGEIDKDDEAAIAARVARAQFPELAETKTVAKNDHRAALARYAARYEDLLPPDDLDGLRIGVFAHSSVATDIVENTLAGLGARTRILGRSERFLAVDTEALGTAMEADLASWAARHQLDGIVSTDPDGDRPLVVDQRGRPVRGDILGLAAAVILGADTVVTPVTSNSGIVRHLGFDVVRTRVGSPFVIAGMRDAVRRDGVIVGFEANGGVLLGSPVVFGGRRIEPLATRDALLPILTALAIVRRRQIPLSGLRSLWSLPVAASDKIERIARSRSQALVASLSASRSALVRLLVPCGDVDAVDTTDGLRAMLNNGRCVHLRPSGNADDLRIYVEAEDDDAAAQLLARVRQSIEAMVSN